VSEWGEWEWRASPQADWLYDPDKMRTLMRVLNDRLRVLDARKQALVSIIWGYEHLLNTGALSELAP